MKKINIDLKLLEKNINEKFKLVSYEVKQGNTGLNNERNSEERKTNALVAREIKYHPSYFGE